MRVDLTNHGDEKAAPLNVEGELFGRLDSVRLDKGIGPGETQSVLLRYPATFPRPGRHVLALSFEYTQASTGAVSQRAYLLLALGTNPSPAVRLLVPDASLESAGALAVRLESADGDPHRVRLDVLTPKTVRAVVPDREIVVPARGSVAASVPLFRGAAPWGTDQGVVVVAGANEGPEERAAVTTAVVHVVRDPAWLPRLRAPLLLLAVALLTGALLVEVRRQRPLC